MADFLRQVWRAASTLGSSRKAQAFPRADYRRLCDQLLEPSSTSESARLSRRLSDHYRTAGNAEKAEFFRLLVDDYGSNRQEIDFAIARYAEDPGHAAIVALHQATESRRRRILQCLNAIDGGTALLVSMRRDAMSLAAEIGPFQGLDEDFADLFSAWFNAGFLVMRRLDWQSSGDVLQRLIQYEAVHDIGSWSELRDRLEPEDRRCYAFFHPSMPQDPLIFVEVALTMGIPSGIDEILGPRRAVVDPTGASAAVFYSISNCQPGLRGIPFGGALIKKVADELSREWPGLSQFVTLSPVPKFAQWLDRLRADETSALTERDRAALGLLDTPGWHEAPDSAARLRPLLRGLAAAYLSGLGQARVSDPVGRFHLGNGARLEQVNWPGNLGPRGLKESFGVMVNYRYDLADLEQNYRAFHRSGIGAVSPAVGKLARQALRPGRAVLPRAVSPQ